MSEKKKKDIPQEQPKPEEAPSTSTRLGPLKEPAPLTLAICCCTAARQPMGWQLRATQPWIWG